MRSLALFASLCGLAGVAGSLPNAAAQTTSRVAVPTTTISGAVIWSQASWTADGARIITRSTIRAADGTEHHLHQLGGTLGKIGMRTIPSAPLLRVGDRVRVQVRGVATKRSAQIVNVLSQHGSAPVWSVRTTNTNNAPLYWSSGCVLITYDAAGTTHVDGDGEFAVLDAVFAHWRAQMQSCSYMTFSMQGRESQEVGLDGINLIKFRDTEWCRPATEERERECYSPGAAGLTTLFFIDDESSSRDGEILDADIELNGVNFAISVGGVSNGSSDCLSDLANTLTHEVGHLLGMDHTCFNGQGERPVDHLGTPIPSCTPANSLPQYITEATMYNFQECSETKKASLHEDDVEGVCLIYPLAGDPGECTAPDLGGGGCGVVAGGERNNWPLVLVTMTLVIAVVRKRSANARRPDRALRRLLGYLLRPTNAGVRPRAPERRRLS